MTGLKQLALTVLVAATVWYADGVGPVKQKVDAGGQTIALELKKFTAGK